MTLKELAKKIGKSTSEISRILGKVGFRGIYKDAHTVPDEAIPLVEAQIVNNNDTDLQALPSANYEPSAIQEPTQTAPEAQAGQGQDHIINELQAKVGNSYQAKSQAQRHIGDDTLQKELDNRALAGVTKGLLGQLAENEAYLSTIGMLYSREIMEQNLVINDLLNKISDPAFFGQKTAPESYYNISKNSTSNALLQNAMNAVENLANPTPENK